MQKQNKKDEIVDFVKERYFGELIGAPFYFIKQEFKPFARTLIRFAGPWVAVALLGMTLLSNTLYQAFDSNIDPSRSFVIYLLVLGFFLMIGFLAALVTTHSYVTLYVRNGKDNFTIEDVGDLVKRNVVKIFFAGILVYLMVVAGFFIFYLPGIYLAVALTFFSIIIVYEDASIGKSISRSFKVVKGHWWLTLGVTIVFSMIIASVSYIFIIPIYVVIIAAAIGGTTIGAGSVIVIVLSVALYFVAYIFFISLQQVLIGFLYFSLVTKKEGLGLFDRIDAINKEDDTEGTNIFEVKKEEQKQDDNSTLNNEDDIKKDIDETDNNRFEDENDNNRFKPKY